MTTLNYNLPLFPHVSHEATSYCNAVSFQKESKLAPIYTNPEHEPQSLPKVLNVRNPKTWAGFQIANYKVFNKIQPHQQIPPDVLAEVLEEEYSSLLEYQYQIHRNLPIQELGPRKTLVQVKMTPNGDNGSFSCCFFPTGANMNNLGYIKEEESTEGKILDTKALTFSNFWLKFFKLTLKKDKKPGECVEKIQQLDIYKTQANVEFALIGQKTNSRVTIRTIRHSTQQGNRFLQSTIIDSHEMKVPISHFCFNLPDSPVGYSYPEVSIVCGDGSIYCSPLSKGGVFKNVEKIGQVGANSENLHRWHQCCYSLNPGIIYVTDPENVYLVDKRQGNLSRKPIFQLPNDLCRGEKIQYFEINKKHPYQNIILTDSEILITDQRYLNKSLFSWKHLVESPTNLSVSNEWSKGQFSDYNFITTSNFQGDCLVYQYKNGNEQDLDIFANTTLYQNQNKYQVLPVRNPLSFDSILAHSTQKIFNLKSAEYLASNFVPNYISDTALVKIDNKSCYIYQQSTIGDVFRQKLSLTFENLHIGSNYNFQKKFNDLDFEENTNKKNIKVMKDLWKRDIILSDPKFIKPFEIHKRENSSLVNLRFKCILEEEKEKLVESNLDKNKENVIKNLKIFLKNEKKSIFEIKIFLEKVYSEKNLLFQIKDIKRILKDIPNLKKFQIKLDNNKTNFNENETNIQFESNLKQFKGEFDIQNPFPFGSKFLSTASHGNSQNIVSIEIKDQKNDSLIFSGDSKENFKEFNTIFYQIIEESNNVDIVDMEVDSESNVESLNNDSESLSQEILSQEILSQESENSEERNKAEIKFVEEQWSEFEKQFADICLEYEETDFLITNELNSQLINTESNQPSTEPSSQEIVTPKAAPKTVPKAVPKIASRNISSPSPQLLKRTKTPNSGPRKKRKFGF